MKKSNKRQNPEIKSQQSEDSESNKRVERIQQVQIPAQTGSFQKLNIPKPKKLKNVEILTYLVLSSKLFRVLMRQLATWRFTIMLM